MLSFDEKVLALTVIRQMDLKYAVLLISRMKRQSPVTVREEIDVVHSTHYLLDDGLVQKTELGTIQYVDLKFPQQPLILTEESFAKCKPNRQQDILKGLSILRCHTLLRQLRPAPIKKFVIGTDPLKLAPQPTA